ncbi:MAG: superoxide dismutase family protein [Colwellia sp.]|nr:superoxide dismutase family protein [Colwellia sp.]
MNHKNNNSNLLLLLKVIILLWSSQCFSTIITDLNAEDRVSRLFANDSIIFSENYRQELNTGRLIHYSLYAAGDFEHNIADKKALGLVANLLISGNVQGPLALANYLKRFPNDFVAFQLAAVQLVGKKLYPQAELALQEVLKLSPNYTPASMLMGISMYMQENYQAGTEHLEKAIKNNDANILAYRYLSWNFIRKNEYNQAKSILEKSLRVQGIPTIKADIIHLELAEIYRLLEEYEKIIILFQKLIDSEKLDLSQPDNLEAISRYFEAAAFTGNLIAAKRAEIKLQSTPAYASFPATMSRARLLSLDGKTKEAITLLNSVDSDDFFINQTRLLNMARLYATAKMNQKGMSALDSYLDNFEGDLTMKRLQNYIEIAIILGEGNKALGFLKELVNNNKDNLKLAYLLASTLFESGDLTAAMDEANNIISKDRNFAYAYYLKGVIYYNRNKNDEASHSFRSAIDIDPTYINAWLALFGALHDHRKHSHSTSNASADHEELIPLLKDAISKNPNEPILLYELGLTLYSGGALEEAQVAFDEILRLVPFDFSALYMSSIVRADRGVELKIATELADIAAQLVPDNPVVQDSYGWSLIRSGMVIKGMEHSQKALKNAQDDPVIQLHIGYGNYLLNNYKLAKLYFLDALNGELPPHSAILIRKTLHKMEPVGEKVLLVNNINGFGVGDEIGTIRLIDSTEGLRVEAEISGLPAGFNGMHIHEKPSCDAGFKGETRIAGMAAGGHYGHSEHSTTVSTNGSSIDHSSMLMKAKGDLPPLKTDKGGRSMTTVIGKKLVLSELRGRSLMIHSGQDLNGVSGEKIACAIIN